MFSCLSTAWRSCLHGSVSLLPSLCACVCACVCAFVSEAPKIGKNIFARGYGCHIFVNSHYPKPKRGQHGWCPFPPFSRSFASFPVRRSDACVSHCVFPAVCRVGHTATPPCTECAPSDFTIAQAFGLARTLWPRPPPRSSQSLTPPRCVVPLLRLHTRTPALASSHMPQAAPSLAATANQLRHDATAEACLCNRCARLQFEKLADIEKGGSKYWWELDATRRQWRAQRKFAAGWGGEGGVHASAQRRTAYEWVPLRIRLTLRLDHRGQATRICTRCRPSVHSMGIPL